MFGLIVAVGSAAGVVAFEYDLGPKVLVAITVYEGDPLGSREAGSLSVLSQPTLQMSGGQTGYVQSGQDVTVPGPDGTKMTHPVGLALVVKPTLRTGGRVSLELNATLQQVDPRLGVETAAGLVPGFTEQSVRAAWVVRPGEPFRQRIAARSAADQTWVEVTVRPAK